MGHGCAAVAAIATSIERHVRHAPGCGNPFPGLVLPLAIPRRRGQQRQQRTAEKQQQQQAAHQKTHEQYSGANSLAERRGSKCKLQAIYKAPGGKSRPTPAVY